MRALLLTTLAVAACGGRYGATQTTPRGIESAGLPYRFVDARTGHDVPEAEAWTKLAGARAVCVGEEHPNPHHHWAQLHVVEELARRAKVAGVALAIGMEWFQRPFQGVLDDYAAGRIDDAALVSRSGWADRWGYDYELYRPILHRARTELAALIALNQSKEIVKKMSHEGIEGLTAEERAKLPELVLDDARHRAWFDALMADMGGATAHSSKPAPDADAAGSDAAPTPPTPEEEATAKQMADRVYAVQVLWDESMADGAATWIGAQPGRAMIVLAGNGHCHDSAIVGRIKRRGIADAISVLPIIDDGENVAAELATPMNDYLFVMTMPSGAGAEAHPDPER